MLAGASYLQAWPWPASQQSASANGMQGHGQVVVRNGNRSRGAVLLPPPTAACVCIMAQHACTRNAARSTATTMSGTDACRTRPTTAGSHLRYRVLVRHHCQRRLVRNADALLLCLLPDARQEQQLEGVWPPVCVLKTRQAQRHQLFGAGREGSLESAHTGACTARSAAVDSTRSPTGPTCVKQRLMRSEMSGEYVAIGGYFPRRILRMSAPCSHARVSRGVGHGMGFTPPPNRRQRKLRAAQDRAPAVMRGAGTELRTWLSASKGCLCVQHS